MRKQLACLMFCAMSTSAAVMAHHSYAEYDRARQVSIEGTLERLTFANPHAMLYVRTDENKVFSAEWGSVMALVRTGVTAEMLAAGDRIVVTGSPTHDATLQRLSLLTQVVRPKDGWQWSKTGGTAVTPPASR